MPVHPHVRGEYIAIAITPSAPVGSPPRAWGIRPGASNSVRRDGSPPRAWGIPRRRSSDHDGIGSPPRAWGIRHDSPRRADRRIRFTPHVRGEYGNPPSHNVTGIGSPPRAWGIPDEQVLLRLPLRFTPTCVGNTRDRHAAGRRVSVHPHVRGEYASAASLACCANGSPPRAWGIPASHVPMFVGGRFTPTCVGNTILTLVRI